ncbi:MAG: hypothetical protein QN178_14600 [Armatimonadota bacterium]|nr:hypothetical protein [Armatimonadota bacterium]
MAGFVVGRFLADCPIRPGMVRAILDTLSAQGGAYEPHLVRRASGEAPSRITWSRPGGLFDDVTQEGRHTTFLRVAEGRPEPVLTLRISGTPRTQPSLVSLSVPEEVLASSQEIERILGVCKGLYLFLESPWGTVHRRARADDVRMDAVPPVDAAAVSASPCCLLWANFFGPNVVARVGPARFLTSAAFIIEILPDGGIMLVSHPSPGAADTADGRAARAHLEDVTGIGEALRAIGLAPADRPLGHQLSGPRVRRRLPH